jgi:hypothetical protein
MNVKPVKSVSKVAAILLTALGSFLVGACFFLLGLSRSTHHDKSTLTETFILIARTCYPFAFAVGVFCLSFAFKAWSRISTAVIRRLSLIVAVVFCIWLFEFAKPRLEEDDSTLASTLSTILLNPAIILLAGGLFHFLYSKCLIKCLCLPDTIDWDRREKAARSFFLWVAFFLFFPFFLVFAVVTVFELKALAAKIGLHVGQAWGLGLIVLVGLIAVLLLAYLFYKISVLFYKTSVRIALRNKPVQAKEKADDKPQAQ